MAIFNPLISLLAMRLLPLQQIGANKEDLLAQMGLIASGRLLQIWVSVDAVLVLSGAVLTSYVGVTGLVRRMTLDQWIIDLIEKINSQAVIFFSRGDNLASFNRAALYVLENEQTKRLIVVHCYEDEESIPATLAEQLKTIDKIYPQLRIDLMMVKGKFGPELIERLSQRMCVPKNYMFIGTPGDRFPHSIADLGGVRLII